MMTLDLSPEEDAALAELAKEKDMSKKAVIRQALRLYQMVSIKQRTHRMTWVDNATGIPEQVIVFGCGDIG